MPFKSEAQRRYLFSQHPDIAKRWTAEEKKDHKKPKRLPKKVSKKTSRGRRRS